MDWGYGYATYYGCVRWFVAGIADSFNPIVVSISKTTGYSLNGASVASNDMQTYITEAINQVRLGRRSGTSANADVQSLFLVK